MKKLHLILILPSLLLFTACEREIDVTETNNYNAFFVYPEPDAKKAYVGTVVGLSSCKYVVSNYYTKRRKYIKGEWDYICCLKTEDHDCAEKHRYKDN